MYGQKQEDRRLVRIEEVPELLVTGLQAVEDRDFNHHFGIDVTGMVRAAFKTATGTKQGASTLTQQLARSGLLGIGREQTLTRKGKEILYALLIDARYDKRTILEAYLNQVDLTLKEFLPADAELPPALRPHLREPHLRELLARPTDRLRQIGRTRQPCADAVDQHSRVVQHL